MKVRTWLAAGALAAAATLPAAATEEKGRLEIGMLDCRLAQSSNLVIVSGRTFTCTYDPYAEGAPNEIYTAKVTKLGLDLSRNTAERVRWLVLAPSEPLAKGVLKGTYVGAAADVTVGVGAGVRALVGGFEDSIALQPASISTTEGLGISAGVEEVELTYGGVQY
ncbi:MAG TPA: DUF992 domain-containing protein [Paracoccaceae bacterium]|nr:DUF992 domain-containing protein [Paracoccaceae bacterium]